MSTTSDPFLFEECTGELPRKNKRPKGQRLRVFLIIKDHIREHGHFPRTVEIVDRLHGEVTSWGRGHMVTWLRDLEASGFIARRVGGANDFWHEQGYLTPLGEALAKELPQAAAAARRGTPWIKTGGGLASDGGTLHKKMLRSADSFEGNLIPLADRFSKLGSRVLKGGTHSRQKGLIIATFSLEEGRTCDPNCGMKDECFAGKMSRQKRILYEGPRTDRAVSDAIGAGKPRHIRINTIGDFPTESFLEAVLTGVRSSESTAFGYTHWQPEHPLGARIREVSDENWDFFSIRTSYEHGSRAPLSERGAVVVDAFDPEVLRVHGALPCPEQTGKAKNCGACGLCWNTRQNVAFKRH